MKRLIPIKPDDRTIKESFVNPDFIVGCELIEEERADKSIFYYWVFSLSTTETTCKSENFKTILGAENWLENVDYILEPKNTINKP